LKNAAKILILQWLIFCKTSTGDALQAKLLKELGEEGAHQLCAEWDKLGGDALQAKLLARRVPINFAPSGASSEVLHQKNGERIVNGLHLQTLKTLT
jgi:hypothetical protein